jgi:hypothetical protein
MAARCGATIRRHWPLPFRLRRRLLAVPLLAQDEGSEETAEGEKLLSVSDLKKMSDDFERCVWVWQLSKNMQAPICNVDPSTDG